MSDEDGKARPLTVGIVFTLGSVLVAGFAAGYGLQERWLDLLDRRLQASEAESAQYRRDIMDLDRQLKGTEFDLRRTEEKLAQVEGERARLLRECSADQAAQIQAWKDQVAVIEQQRDRDQALLDTTAVRAEASRRSCQGEGEGANPSQCAVWESLKREMATLQSSVTRNNQRAVAIQQAILEAEGG